MHATIAELMVSKPITATPSQTVEHVRGVMTRNGVHSLPVVNPENEPIGIVTATDMLTETSNGTPISRLMSRKVYTIPQYSGPHIAARMMRNHDIHHLVVTHEGAITGIVSSFDLLRLVEDHRFVMKNASTPTQKHTGDRGRTEA